MMRRGEDKIDVTPFQERMLELLRSGVTWADIARRVGYLDSRDRVDTSRLQRDLGLRDECTRHGRRSRRRVIGYDKALLLCAGLELDPFEVGV